MIGSINSIPSALYTKAAGMDMTGKINPAQLDKTLQAGATGAAGETQPTSFGSVFEGLVNSVESKQVEANQLTKQVLLGNTDQLHQSVIAMQEASVAFSMMIEVRNKLVDSYQELMRMPV
jgi:flagellar hook-basal body complex protein FliE